MRKTVGLFVIVETFCCIKIADLFSKRKITAKLIKFEFQGDHLDFQLWMLQQGYPLFDYTLDQIEPLKAKFFQASVFLPE